MDTFWKKRGFQHMMDVCPSNIQLTGLRNNVWISWCPRKSKKIDFNFVGLLLLSRKESQIKILTDRFIAIFIYFFDIRFVLTLSTLCTLLTLYFQLLFNHCIILTTHFTVCFDSLTALLWQFLLRFF